MVALPHWRLTLSSLFHAVIGYSALFDWGLLNNIKLEVTQLTNDSLLAHYGATLGTDASQWFWAITSSTPLFGGLIMCLFVKYPMEKFGRRNTGMVLKNIVLLPALAIQILARWTNCIEFLLLGRLLSGAAVGLTVVLPTYVGECSPTQWRSLMGSLCNGIGVRLWVLLGAQMGYMVSGEAWNYVYLCPLAAAALHLLCTPLFPKSIKHQIIVKEVKDTKVLRKKTSFYHGPNVNMEKLAQEMKREADISPTVKVADLKLALRAPQFRWPFILCCLTYLLIPLSGNYISLSYSTSIFESVGMSNAQLYSVLLSVMNLLVSTLCSILLIPWLGCRFMLLFGVALAVVGTSCMGVNALLSNASEGLAAVLSLVGLLLINAGSNGGAGILGPMLPAEVAPQASRSITCAVGGAQFFFASLTIVLIFPPINDVMGTYCFLPLTAFNLFAFFFNLKYFPTTKNLPIDKIVKRWMPDRKAVGLAVPDVTVTCF